MSKRCKHVKQNGFNCGSYAFNLYMDDIDQGDLCDVHYWQAKAQRTWVGLTEEDRAEILSRKWWDFEDAFDVDGFLRLAEAKLKEKNT